jgi:mannose-6-phosphate isomerase-like protein (cupin superfamily)
MKDDEKLVTYKPWGREEIWFEDDNYIGKLIVLEGGKRTSLHFHELSSEKFMIVYGKGMIEIGDMVKGVSYGDVVVIGRGIKHRIFATDGEMRIVEMRGNKGDDVVRVEDDYGRVL